MGFTENKQEQSLSPLSPLSPSLSPLSPTRLKIIYGEEIRLFSPLSYSSYSSLVERIITIFDIDPSLSFVLKYLDEEGDKVTMSSEEELKEAIRLGKEMPRSILRCYVEVKKEKRRRTNAPLRGHKNAQRESTNIGEITTNWRVPRGLFGEFSMADGLPHSASALFYSPLVSYYVPRGTFGVYSLAQTRSDNILPTCNFITQWKVHRETNGAFSNANERMEEEKVESEVNNNNNKNGVVHRWTGGEFSPAINLEKENEKQQKKGLSNNHRGVFELEQSFAMIPPQSKQNGESKLLAALDNIL